MIVPGPPGRHDEVSGMQYGLFPVYAGVRPRAFDDEAQSVCRVSVRRGNLARQNDLQSGVETLRNAISTGDPRIFQHHHTSLGFLRGDERRCLGQIGPDIRVTPDRWYAG